MRHLLLFLAFVAGAGLLFVSAIYLVDGDMTGLLFVVLGLGLIIGTIVSIRRKGRQMREDLLAGRDVVARWQVSGTDLGAFHSLDRERTSIGSEYRNWLNIPQSAPSEGLPIVIGRASWLIGDRLYAQGTNQFGLLANVAELEADPGYIEVAVLGERNGPGYLLILLRLPAPAGARSAVRAAVDHLVRRVPDRNQALLRRWFPGY